MIEEPDFGSFGIKPQTRRNAVMGVTIGMAAMPFPVAVFIGPVGHQPDLLRGINRAYYFHANEPQRIVHKVGAVNERLPYLCGHVIGNGEPAHRDECGWVCDGWRGCLRGLRSRRMRDIGWLHRPGGMRYIVDARAVCCGCAHNFFITEKKSRAYYRKP